MQGFDFKEDVKEVIIDLTHAHIWDVTSVAMFDSVVSKFKKNGVNVTVRGLNEASTNMIDKYGTHTRI
jgi:SulP family sulfate permease